MPGSFFWMARQVRGVKQDRKSGLLTGQRPAGFLTRLSLKMEAMGWRVV
jgi:hypothetical protein